MGDHRMAKIVIITDAWEPQVSGVVTTYKNIIANLPDNIEIQVIHPGLFKSFKFPFYKEIDVSLCTYKQMSETLLKIKETSPVNFHIATEGPLGFQAKRVLDKHNISYTTAYHTKFPEFFKELYGLPVKATKWYFNWFHKKAKYVLCSSASNAKENSNWNSVVLEKGYDYYFSFAEKFRDNQIVLLYVGRVSKEKNIDAFCDLDLSGFVPYLFNVTKVIVGDGPYRKALEKKYPNIKFLGYKFGLDLAKCYQMSDVLVFPSKVDTYGIVILESMACGTPVAAYPVTGAIDQIKNGINGCTDEDLSTAVCYALDVDRGDTHLSVKGINWKKSAEQFVSFVSH